VDSRGKIACGCQERHAGGHQDKKSAAGEPMSQGRHYASTRSLHLKGGVFDYHDRLVSEKYKTAGNGSALVPA
jgi:hypothetical protein